MGLLCVAFGGIMALVGWVWILINAFSESVPWGVGVFCFSPLAIVYGVLKWDELKLPTILYGVGVVLSIVGRVIGT